MRSRSRCRFSPVCSIKSAWVLFHAVTFAAASEGIEYVLIGGELALEHGEIIRNDCGKAVRK